MSVLGHNCFNFQPINAKAKKKKEVNSNKAIRKSIITCRLASQNKLPNDSAVVKNAKQKLQKLDSYNSSLDILDHFGKRTQAKNDYTLASSHSFLINQIKCNLKWQHDEEKKVHAQQIIDDNLFCYVVPDDVLTWPKRKQFPFLKQIAAAARVEFFSKVKARKVNEQKKSSDKLAPKQKTPALQATWKSASNFDTQMNKSQFLTE